MWFSKVYDPLQAGSIDGTDALPHDNAIKRAQQSHYHPPKELSSDPAKTIYVGRLNFNTTEESLRSYFEQFGEITHIRLIYNLVTGTSQGYSFITFKHENNARTAYDKANHAVLDDHIILVDYERSRGMKGWVPRRLGGGFGGKKESGQLRFGARDKPFRWPARMGRGDGHHISHDQRRSDNWCQFSDEARKQSPSRRTSGRRSTSSNRHRSQSPRKRSSTSSHRHQERTSHTSHYEPPPRDRSPSRYHREDRSPRRHNSKDDRSAKRQHRDDRSSQRYRRRDDRSPRRRRD